VLELAVFLSVKAGDAAAFERNFSQLRVYYGDARGLAGLPPSPHEPTLCALNLLRLLVANRIAEFHTELEVSPPEVAATPEVAHVVRLEQWLMEGAYNKVLDARAAASSEYFQHFLDQLSSTVRWGGPAGPARQRWTPSLAPV
jgi:26S proteasome regulatory subunit N12